MVLLIDTNIVLDVLLNRSEICQRFFDGLETLRNRTGKGLPFNIDLCQYDVCHEKAADTRSD